MSQKDIEGAQKCKQLLTVDQEETNNNIIKHSKRRRGGWTTFPFILGCMFGLTLATGGWIGNLIVYLISKYNVKSIDATQINNVVFGCFFLFPLLAAIISDSFLGPFPVIILSSLVSLLGMILLTLTAAIPSLRPSACTNMSLPCESPSKAQYGILYITLGLACIGFGGSRFTTATMGADQFEDSNSIGIYFNWYYCLLYVSGTISSTAIVYVQDNVSWTIGFGICVATNVLGLLLFLSGKNFYKRIKPKGSPFASIARVVVAAIRKRKVSPRNQDYYYDINDKSNTIPSNGFRFLNRGALKLESDVLITRSWSLSTVQEVEDLKTLIRIMPLWSSSVLLSALVGMFNNFIILQALAMDRHLGGSNFKIPAASFLFFNTLSTSISIFLLDRFLFPMWQKLSTRSLTPLQKIGIGHVLNVAGLVSSALIEARRLHVAKSHNPIGSGPTIVSLAALWLVVPLTIVGISEGFHFPGQILLYYEEFPVSLRSTSSAMISLLVGVGYYLSTAITSLIRKSTTWLMDDLNDGRLDMVYWMLAILGVVNFGYFIICAKMFKHKLKNHDDQSHVENVSTS
uniref:protein NRT1/ PTR FAMILY 2.7-like n=1 Tax=Erigeron canadensis TaxID=72917 RepID=UPI001CB96D51|nr:protein NRT1/ PTR FAMILY 2.7-like [Erigeron canadensis]